MYNHNMKRRRRLMLRWFVICLLAGTVGGVHAHPGQI